VRRRRTIAGVAAALMLALPATALATSLDGSSTSKFVVASLRPVRASLSKQSQEHAAANALISRIQSACPGAVPASLATGSGAQRQTWGAFSVEALGEFSLALIGPVLPAERRAIREIAPLRWTSAALNRHVAAFVRSARGLLALHPPDICVQAKTAAATGFAVVPPATAAFSRRYTAAASASAPTAVELADKMKPLADPHALAAIGQFARLEARLTRDLSRFALPALDRLSNALFSK
jgi:hypothetical protein